MIPWIRKSRHTVRRGFSLLELMISIGILGVGLIMVASVFPVAISEHRAGVQRSSAQQLAVKAAGIVEARLLTQQLHVPPPNYGVIVDPAAPFIPNNWFVVPTEVLVVNNADTGVSTWLGSNEAVGGYNANNINSALNYFNALSGFPVAGTTTWPFAFTNTMLISRKDMFLGAAPLDNNRREHQVEFVWYAFYATGQTPPDFNNVMPNPPLSGFGAPAAGRPRFAIAVCQSSPEQLFSDQMVINPNARPTNFSTFRDAMPGGGVSRYPVPWRIEVQRLIDGPPVINNKSRILVNPRTGLDGAVLLAEIAPAGSKILNSQTGHVYTVARTSPRGNPNEIEIVEDGSILPVDTGPNTAAFHVYVFPPDVIFDNGAPAAFGKRSPVIDFFFF